MRSTNDHPRFTIQLLTTPFGISENQVRSTATFLDDLLRDQDWLPSGERNCILYVGHHRKSKTFSSTRNLARHLAHVQTESPQSYYASFGTFDSDGRGFSIVVSQISEPGSPRLVLQIELSGWDDELSERLTSHIFVNQAIAWNALSGKRSTPEDSDKPREFPCPRGLVPSKTHGLILDPVALDAVGGVELLRKQSSLLATYKVGDVEYTAASIRREITPEDLSTWLDAHLAKVDRPFSPATISF
jgi:hypothetical protein